MIASHDVLNRVKELGYNELRTDYYKKVEELFDKIAEVLNKWDVAHEVIHFPALVPRWVEWELKVDGEIVPSLPSGLVSGEIDLNLKDSSDLDTSYASPNINFNSHLVSMGDMSTPVFYWAPALSVSKESVVKILRKGKAEGYLKVEPVSVLGRHIIAGELERPEKVFVVHYDSLWKGVIDNGLSVALFLELLSHKMIQRDMVLFLGLSELALWPKYWEYSMITARRSLGEVLEGAEVIAVDCIGFKNTSFISDREYVEAYSPLKEDIKIFGTPVRELLEVYHSTNDGLEAVSMSQLERDIKEIVSMLSR